MAGLPAGVLGNMASFNFSGVSLIEIGQRPSRGNAVDDYPTGDDHFGQVSGKEINGPLAIGQAEIIGKTSLEPLDEILIIFPYFLSSMFGNTAWAQSMVASRLRAIFLSDTSSSCSRKGPPPKPPRRYLPGYLSLSFRSGSF
jgi:hypothetical protein